MLLVYRAYGRPPVLARAALIAYQQFWLSVPVMRSLTPISLSLQPMINDGLIIHYIIE